ncbi:MAG: succinylglutamate-semialdehyde dehydrogenase [Phycisphaerae bacterium]
MPSHLIGKAWLAGEGTPLESIDPATGQVVWQGRHATPAEVDAAVFAARAAFEPWATRPEPDRIAIVERFAELLKQERTSSDPTGLPLLISRETGKPRWEALAEIDSMANKIPVSIKAQHDRRSPSAAELPSDKPATRYKPHGVVAVFGPFNFPGHLPNGHIVPALIAGNTVVFKPSELTPGVAARTAELWQAAGLPPGVLNLVQGARDTGQALAAHPGIDGLFFTGSVAAGVALNKLLADRPGVIVALEMGGNNPLVAWDVADGRLDAAALIVAQSAYATAGQRCSCARRLIVEFGPRGQMLLDRVLALIPRLRIGPHTADPEPFMGPLIRPAAADRALAAQQHLLDLGAVPIRPMTRLPLAASPLTDAQSAFVSPGLIDVTHVPNVPDEEIFAPLLQAIRVPTFEAAIAAASATAFGLCAALISSDPRLYETFYARVRAGVVNFNRSTTGASSALPFGGVGLSGNHRPSAAMAADYCSYPVASMEAVDITGPDKPPLGVSPP